MAQVRLRKAAACLVAAAFGVYLATHTGRTEPVPSFAEEEQEALNSVPCPVGDLVYQTPSDKQESEFGVELSLQLHLSWVAEVSH